MAFDLTTVVKQYADPADEVRACRTKSALFDFSFVARARMNSAVALPAINRLTKRSLHDLLPGQIRYAVRENRSGHLVSDLTIWRHRDHYELMSGRAEDIADLVGAAPAVGDVQDLSATTSIFAVQGPSALQALSRLMEVSAISRLGYFTFAEVSLRGLPCIVGRLGYTGEAGFELVLPSSGAKEVWDLLAREVQPAGFIAADILRIEAGFVLFANEFRMPVTASEAGLERFAGQPTGATPEITLVCFRAATREQPVLWSPPGPILRPVQSGTIGVTSACHSAEAGGTLGLGFALRSDVHAGVPLYDPNGIFKYIRLVSLPFFDPSKRRPRAAWAAAHHR